jgi:hypothetical protein
MGARSFVEPFGGIGFRAWTRDLHDGTTSSGTVAYGYTEEWITLHARIGLRAGADLSEKTSLFAEAGLKLPFYNVNNVYLGSGSNGPDITLWPGLKSSVVAEAGMKFRHFKGSVFYDGMRFSQSDRERVSGGYVIQPVSVADIYGLKLGAAF